MTRETKIGLLVGLAFIIVIGILLSDHMSATNEPPQASLDGAQATAHTAVVTPGESRNPPITNVITPNDFTPAAPVPTRDELAQRKPIGDIRIDGPSNTGPQTQTNDTASNTNTGNTSVALNNNTAGIAEVAKAHGEDLVDPNTHTTILDPTPAPKPAGPKTYTIQSGDNLNKIALKTMGASTKATRDAIVKANPKLAANPDRIIAGQTLVIPSAATATATNTNTTATQTRVLALNNLTPPQDAKPRTSSNNGNVYIVKDGDNSLWGIARDQCGTPQAVAAIKELNKDVLKDRDIIRVGMRLKLPAKSVAMAD